MPNMSALHAPTSLVEYLVRYPTVMSFSTTWASAEISPLRSVLGISVNVLSWKVKLYGSEERPEMKAASRRISILLNLAMYTLANLLTSHQPT